MISSPLGLPPRQKTGKGGKKLGPKSDEVEKLYELRDKFVDILFRPDNDVQLVGFGLKNDIQSVEWRVKKSLCNTIAKSNKS